MAGGTGHYLKSIGGRGRLERDEECRLAREIQQGCREARDKLVESNLGFVVKIASEYRNYGLPFEDLLNEGNLGLIRAAHRFDPGRGLKFITYAVWWIRKSIMSALSESTRVVRIPGAQLKKLDRLRETERELHHRLGRPPSVADSARSLSTSERAVRRTMRVAGGTFSLDRPLDESTELTLGQLISIDQRPSAEVQMLDREMARRVNRAIAALNSQQRIVLTLRFGLSGDPPLTLKQAGEILEVSRERVRQIQEQALLRLRGLLRIAPEEMHRRSSNA